MAGKYLKHCVLIKVLLFNICCKSTAEITTISINCLNQTVTVGEPLHLTCNASCVNCTVKEYEFTDVECKEPKQLNSSGSSHSFNCTIQNASVEHNRTFKFWVQMNTGFGEALVHVNIVHSTADSSGRPHAHSITDIAGPSSADSSGLPHADPLTGIAENDPRSRFVVGFMISVFLITAAVIVYRRRKYARHPNSNDDVV